MMTQREALITVLVIALATVLTRALPFFLFPEGRKTPEIVRRMGAMLPCAMMGMLVVYCYKSVNVFAGGRGFLECLAGLFVILIHRRFHNMILSIGGGTALYMGMLALL